MINVLTWTRQWTYLPNYIQERWNWSMYSQPKLTPGVNLGCEYIAQFHPVFLWLLMWRLSGSGIRDKFSGLLSIYCDFILQHRLHNCRECSGVRKL